MNWKHEYSVGVPEIDKEHQLLVRCVTDIENDLLSGEHFNKSHAAIGRLVFFLRIHFSTEEALMRKLNYPHIESHAKEHQDLLADMQNIEKQTLGAPVTARIVDLLREWLEPRRPPKLPHLWPPQIPPPDRA